MTGIMWHLRRFSMTALLGFALVLGGPTARDLTRAAGSEPVELLAEPGELVGAGHRTATLGCVGCLATLFLAAGLTYGGLFIVGGAYPQAVAFCLLGCYQAAVL